MGAQALAFFCLIHWLEQPMSLQLSTFVLALAVLGARHRIEGDA